MYKILIKLILINNTKSTLGLRIITTGATCMQDIDYYVQTLAISTVSVKPPSV